MGPMRDINIIDAGHAPFRTNWGLLTGLNISAVVNCSICLPIRAVPTFSFQMYYFSIFQITATTPIKKTQKTID